MCIRDRLRTEVKPKQGVDLFLSKNANIHTTRLLSTDTAMAKISTACPMAIFLNILSHQNSKGGENSKKKKKKKVEHSVG